MYAPPSGIGEGSAKASSPSDFGGDSQVEVPDGIPPAREVSPAGNTAPPIGTLRKAASVP